MRSEIPNTLYAGVYPRELLTWFTTGDLDTILKVVEIITYFQIHSILTNKAKVKSTKINVNSFVTSEYEKADNWLLGKTKPIQSQLKPKQSQFKPKCQKAKNDAKCVFTKD